MTAISTPRVVNTTAASNGTTKDLMWLLVMDAPINNPLDQMGREPHFEERR